MKSYQRTDIEEIHYTFYQVRPLVSHLEVFLSEITPTPNNIAEALKDPEKQLCKEALYLQYDKNKNVSPLLSCIPIKSLPELTKFLSPLISPSIN